MTVRNVRALVEAERAGQSFFSTWRKQPTQTTAANIWFDLSMSPGNPVPNYWIGPSNVFTPLRQSTDGGIPHGGNVAPAQKFLCVFEAQTATATAVPLPLWLCDYLGFYPFVDESVIDEQFLVNSTPLPRYADGAGVMILPVVVAGQIGGGTFFVRYTNSQGVSGQQTPQHIMSTQIVNGTIITSGGAVANSRAPFMALAPGDSGVRQIDSIVFEGVGDIGLIALALVKPLARHAIRGINAPAEQCYLMDGANIPEIEDDAYLNLVALPAGTLAAAPIHGYIKTIWA